MHFHCLKEGKSPHEYSYQAMKNIGKDKNFQKHQEQHLRSNTRFQLWGTLIQYRRSQTIRADVHGFSAGLFLS